MATTWSRAPKPVGTIRIRGGGREIKVAGLGARTRWIRYARWWWEVNRGPIPAGMRVGHLDGNTLNDDPENYGLVSAAGILELAAKLDPEMPERRRKAASEWATEFNRERWRGNTKGNHGDDGSQTEHSGGTLARD